MSSTVIQALSRVMMLATATSLMLTACAPPAAAPAKPADAKPADTKPAVPAEASPVTIRVTMWESNEALEPFNNAKVAFEKKFPNIKVQLEPVPQEYGTKLLAQMAAGNAPDVFQLGDGDVSKFVSKNVVEPLDDYIAQDKFDMGVFFPGIAKIGQVSGKTYLFTKDYSPLVMYYNKDLLKKAGVEEPKNDWTWADFLATAKKLTVKDGDKVKQWGVMVPDSWGDPLWLRGTAPFIYQNGADVLSEDGKTATGFLNSPATIEAVQFFSDLIVKDKVAPSKADVAALSGQDLFQTGKVAMLWTGRWPLKDFKANKDLKFGTVALPKNKKAANAICWAGFAIYAKSANKDAAWKWLKFVGAEEGATEFAKYALTAVKSVAEAQGMTNDEYDKNIVSGFDNVVSPPEFRQPKFGDCVEKYYKENMEKVFSGSADVKTALDTAAKQADDCLAQP